MHNRFVKRIKSGDIDSIEELKADFKALAKLTHPDANGSGGDDFIRIRAEYEAAFRDFNRHRFGGSWEGSGVRSDEDAAYAGLAALFKRGFPRLPRHDKQRLRYEYLLQLVRNSCEATLPGSGAAFDAFCDGFRTMMDSGGHGYRAALELVYEIIECRLLGIAELKAVVAIDYARLEGSGSCDPRVVAFLGQLVDGLGKALGS